MGTGHPPSPSAKFKQRPKEPPKIELTDGIKHEKRILKWDFLLAFSCLIQQFYLLHLLQFFASFSSQRVTFRSSRPEAFYKKVVFKNFAILTGKCMCLESFFNKVAGFQAFIKNRLQHRYFPMNIAEILRAPPILKKICERRLLDIFRIIIHSNVPKSNEKSCNQLLNDFLTEL